MALRHVRFLTAGGLEVPPVTASLMRKIDRIAVEETGPNLFQMMENAGRNLALQAIEVLDRTARAATAPLNGKPQEGQDVKALIAIDMELRK